MELNQAPRMADYVQWLKDHWLEEAIWYDVDSIPFKQPINADCLDWLKTHQAILDDSTQDAYRIAWQLRYEIAPYPIPWFMWNHPAYREAIRRKHANP